MHKSFQFMCRQARTDLARQLGRLAGGLCLAVAVSIAQAQGTANQSSGGDGANRKEIQLGAGTFLRNSQLPDWVTTVKVPRTERRNPVVVRLHDTQFMATTRPVVYVHRVTQVNDSSALGQVGQLSVDFYPDYQRLVLHQVRVLRGGSTMDQTATIQVRFLQRELGLEQGVYSGETSATMLVNDLRVGDSVEWSYSVEGSNPVFGNRFADSGNWDAYNPIEKRYLSLTHPTKRRIYWKLVGGSTEEMASVRPTITTRGDMQTLVFERSGMEGHEPEPQLPSHLPYWRYIQFSEFPDWQSVATWAEGLFPDVNPLPDELTKLVTELKREPDPEVRSVKALQWVQDEIRYFSVSMGESSHRPHPPAQVLKQRFGDCKDKSYLLLTILKALNLSARPVLLTARAPNFPSALWPTPLAFDHVVVELSLNGKVYHLDPTRSAQVGSLSTMGMVQYNADVLAVSSQTRTLSKIKPDNALDLNTYNVYESFKISRLDGPAELLSVKTWSGTNAELLRQLVRQLTPEQLDKQSMLGYDRRYPGIELVGRPEIKDDTGKNQVTVTAHYMVPRPLEASSEGWLLPYAMPNMYGVFNLPPSFKRQHPALVVAHPYRAQYKLDINWPDNVSVMQDPRSLRVSHALFELTSDRHFRGNQTQLNVSFMSRGDTLLPQDLGAFAQEMDKVSEAFGRGVFVEKSAIKSGANGQAGLSERLKQRAQTIINRITTTIDSGKLDGESLSDALCDRAETHSGLRQYAQAMQDANEAVRLSPALARAWQCRGAIQVSQGNFTNALPDLNKALNLGANLAVIARYRGIARFYLGQYREAEQEFAKVLAEQPQAESADAVYHALWWAWSMQRQGKTLPDQLLKWAQRDVNGPWPLPALGLLTGRLTPEQLVASLNQRKGDERQLNLSEAWFYIGQYHLQAGRRAMARQAFEQCRAQGITMYQEDTSAEWELLKLGRPAP